MTILQSDIKLLESEVMTDDDNGGGRLTSNQIQSGLVNNMFDDISRLDRTIGRVSLRQFGFGVLSDNDDRLLGAHALVSNPVKDNNVSVVMYKATKTDQRRNEAKDMIESYVIKSVTSRWLPYENQLQGQKALLLICGESIEAPETGQILYLEQNAGTASFKDNYVRVVSVEEEIQTFTDAQGDFKKKVVTCLLANKLSYTVLGNYPARYDGSQPSKVRETSVADATSYYGASKLVSDVNAQSSQVIVDSIFKPLVPSASTPTAISDANAHSGSQPPIELTSWPADVNYELSNTLIEQSILLNGGDRDKKNDVSGKAAVLIFQCAGKIKEKSVVLKMTRSWNSTVDIYTDYDGDGLVKKNTTDTPGYFSINYQAGTIHWIRNTVTAISSVDATYKNRLFIDAIEIEEEIALDYNTAIIEVSQSNQSSVYVKSLKPNPNRAGVKVQFLALGQWYESISDSDGNFSGLVAGSVNEISGTATVTLPYVPDVDSRIIFTYAQKSQFEERTETFNSTVTDTIENLTYSVTEGFIVPGSLSISFTDKSATSRMVTDDGNGVLSMQSPVYLIGRVDYSKGTFSINAYFNSYSTQYHIDSDLTVSYDTATISSETLTPTVNQHVATLTLANTPVRDGSVALTYTLKITQPGAHESDTYVYPGSSKNNRSTVDHATGA